MPQVKMFFNAQCPIATMVTWLQQQQPVVLGDGPALEEDGEEHAEHHQHIRHRQQRIFLYIYIYIYLYIQIQTLLYFVFILPANVKYAKCTKKISQIFV